MGDEEEYRLVQSNKTSPTSHKFIEEVAMQASWSHRATAWHSAVLSQEKHCRHIRGSPGLGLGAMALGWTERLDLAARDPKRAGEPREQPALSGFATATRKPALHQNPDRQRRRGTQGFQTLDVPEGTSREQGCAEGRRRATHPGRSNHWRTPLTWSSSSHTITHTRVPAIDFAVIGPTCAKTGQCSCPSSTRYSAMTSPCHSNTQRQLGSL